MSSSSPYQMLAAHLTSVNSSVKLEERLFRQAVEDVCSKQQNAGVVDIVEKFRQMQTPAEVEELFTTGRKDNYVWRQRDSKSWSRRVARASDTFLKFKPVGDSLAQMNQLIAAPVFAVVCASLAVFQGLIEVDEKLDGTEECLKKHLKNISAICLPGFALPENLEDAIRGLYKSIVEFALQVAIIFKECAVKSWAQVATESLKGELSKFENKLKDAIEYIQMALSTEGRHDLKDIKNALAFPPVAQHTANRCIKYLPSMVSKSFVGRQNALNWLHWQVSQSSPYGVPLRSAFFGTGGVGKSQLSLQYIDIYRVRDISSRDLSVIFLNAHTEASVLAGFSIIAEKLGRADSSMSESDPQKLIARVKNWLEDVTGWLLVFDNVSDISDLQQFIPASGNGHILLTTRSESTAASFAGKPNTLEVKPLEEKDGVNLCFKVSTTADPRSELQKRAAAKIVHVAGGLPIAIEQFVKNATMMRKTWEQMLTICEDTQKMLDQRNFDSTHEHNASIGSIVRISLESLKEKHIRALALFQLLVCMDTSSIPLQLLYAAADDKNLLRWFDRTSSYVPGKMGSVETDDSRLRTSPQKRTTGSRIRKLSPFKARHSEDVVELPRVDSDADLELRRFLTNEQKGLLAVLEDRIHINNAIDVLEHIGLVKKIGEQVYWVHDLFSELTRELNKIDSVKNYCNNVHLISMVIYIGFPEIGILTRLDTCIASLPHAIAVHRHLEKCGLLNHATVGAELSHIIASVLDQARQLSTKRDTPGADLTTVIKFYTQAYCAYEEACRRLEVHQGVSWNRIVASTRADCEMEYTRRPGNPANRIMEWQLLGRNARWRWLQTCTMLGCVMSGAGLFDDGIEYLSKAISWNEKIFGDNAYETSVVLNELTRAYSHKKDHEAAYQSCLRRAKICMGWTEVHAHNFPWQAKKRPTIHTDCSLITTWHGMSIAARLSELCLKCPGRESEAIIWAEISLAGKEWYFDDEFGNLDSLSTPMRMVADAYKNRGKREGYIYWMARSLEASMAVMERDKLYDEDDENYKSPWTAEKDMSEDINAFRELTHDVEDLPLNLQRFIVQVNSRARLWEKLRDTCEVMRKERIRLEDEEFDTFQERLMLFREKYAPAAEVSEIELEILYAECGEEVLSALAAETE